MQLTLQSGGKLIEEYWSSEKKDFLHRDVTNRAVQLLFNSCDLDKNVLLRDILLLLKTNLEQFDLVLGNWCCDLVEEGLKPIEPDMAGKCEYLELYWDLRTTYNDHGKAILSGNAFPAFHGVGVSDRHGPDGKPLKELFGISMAAVSDLAHLPVRLSQEFRLTDDFKDNSPPIVFDNAEYTLGQILYGILWELSFFGSPTMRDAKVEEFRERIKSIDTTKLTDFNPFEKDK